MMNLELQNYKSEDGSLCSINMAQIASLNKAEAFIETGTYLGNTVSAMRNVFKYIYSIELSEELYSQAVKRFAGDQHIKLLFGSSTEKLEEAALMTADLRSVLWLDAHWSAGNTSRGANNTPIIKELKIIAKQNLKEVIIMVDDLRYFAEIQTGFDTHESNYGYPLLGPLIDYIHNIMPAHIPICNGDILLILPRHIYDTIAISSVLHATNKLRTKPKIGEVTHDLEAIISTAQGKERDTLMTLPEIFSPSLRYGIGGDYLYWRGLILENDKLYDQAQNDFYLARKCGISVPTRIWE